MTMKNISPTLSKAVLFQVIISLLLLVGFSYRASTSHAQAKPPYDKATLILGLKQSARDKKLTQADFVQLIVQRGVNFQMTSRDEAELRLAGASDEVIAAARNNYRYVPKPLPKGTGSLRINSTMADCKVLLNGQMRGATDSNGALILSPLRAGQYRIVLKKDEFEEQERAVTVAPGIEVVENFALTKVKGRLTVNPSIPGAAVRLNGIEYPAGVKDLSIPADTYEVRVSKSGFRTFTKSITVNPRSSVTVDAPLESVPVEELVVQASSYLRASQYPQAIAASREILSSHPDNAQATVLLGLAYYYSEQYALSATALTRAVALGEQVILPIRHHHRVLFSDDLCSGRLTVGRGELSFTSADKTGHDFTVAANKIYELTSEPRKGGRVHVQVGIQKGAKEEKKTYNFHVSHAGTRRFDPNNASSITVVYCNNCDEETQVIYQLLRQLKDGPAVVAPQPAVNSEASAGSGPTTIEPPSSVFRAYVNAGQFKLAVPNNWKEVVTATRNVVFAPDGSYTVVNARTNFSHGVQIGIIPVRGATLPKAVEQLVNAIIKSAPYLKQG